MLASGAKASSRMKRLFVVMCVWLLCAGSVQASQHARLWFTDGDINLSGMELLSLMADLGMRDTAQLDIDETRDAERTGQYLTEGLLAINHVAIGHQLAVKKLTYAALADAHREGRLTALIDQQLPQFSEVLALRRAISKMRALTRLDWPGISARFNPRLGLRHDEVARLITLLVRLGDLAPPPDYLRRDFTPQVVAAIKTFQRRHGLAASGSLTAATREKLAWTPAQRLHKLQMNLWRWLSMPSAPPGHYVTVNIPAYELTYWRAGQAVLQMPVIVGAPATPTPIMLTEIDRITVNPPWVPPLSIVKTDLLPALRRAPDFMASQQFHWVSRSDPDATLALEAGINNPAKQLTTHMLVQRPGPHNALGKWRFNIKNNEAIYLHDTPVRQLFDEPFRALSHGCVRLAQADKLAYKLIPSLQQVTTRTTQHRALPEPLPVYLTYQTAVARDNVIVWLDDIYARDDAQLGDMLAQLQSTDRKSVK